MLPSPATTHHQLIRQQREEPTYEDPSAIGEAQATVSYDSSPAASPAASPEQALPQALSPSPAIIPVHTLDEGGGGNESSIDSSRYSYNTPPPHHQQQEQQAGNGGGTHITTPPTPCATNLALAILSQDTQQSSVVTQSSSLSSPAHTGGLTGGLTGGHTGGHTGGNSGRTLSAPPGLLTKYTTMLAGLSGLKVRTTNHSGNHSN